MMQSNESEGMLSACSQISNDCCLRVVRPYIQDVGPSNTISSKSHRVIIVRELQYPAFDV